MYNQAYLFVIFIINGILIGVLFDLFRIFRKSFKTNDVITYIQDIAFWILSGILTLYFIFVFNSGEIRFYIFLGILLGITIYMLTISKSFIKINIKIINIIKNIISIIFFPIKMIFKVIRDIFFKPFNFVFINTKSIFNKIKYKTINFLKKVVKC